VLRHILNLDGGRQAFTQVRLKTWGLGLNLPASDTKDLLIVNLDIGSPNNSQLVKDRKIPNRLLHTRHSTFAIKHTQPHGA
jgi:hypothetical protein